MAYKIQKVAYVQKYGKFDFPDEPPIEKIIEIVKQWRSISNNKQEQSLCDEILDLINDKNQKPISYYQGRVENVQSFSQADPVKSLQMSNLIHDQIDIRNKGIKNDVERNPNIKYGLKMNMQPGSSEFSHIKSKSNIDIQHSNQTNVLLKQEIINNLLDLFKSVGNYFYYPQYSTYEDLEIQCKRAQYNLEKYSNNVQNDFSFVYSYIKIEDEIKKLYSYIEQSKYDKKYDVLKKVKTLLDKYFNKEL